MCLVNELINIPDVEKLRFRRVTRLTGTTLLRINRA